MNALITPSFTRSALVAALVSAALIIPIQAGKKTAKQEKEEREESPPQFFIENLPAAKRLPQAPAPSSVPVFRPEGRKGKVVSLGPVWKAIGPAPLNGQTSVRSDPVSGRATAIALHPTDANIVYLGTAQGGVWRSTNGGGNWVQLMDNATVGNAGTPLAIGSITLSPTDPTTLFVGTGEGNLSADSFFGSGFYIITNADSFNPIVNGPYNAASGLDSGVSAGADIFTGRSIVGIAVDPTNANNVFVATSSGQGGIVGTAYSTLPRRGLYRCTNALAGVNNTGTPAWTRLQITGTTSLNTIATTVAMDPSNPNNLLVSYYGQGATDPTGIYRTTNALAATPTFTQVKALANFINAKLAINKVGSVITVYATTSEGSSSAQGRLYKSTDGGATFGAAIAAVNGFAGGQGFYDIAVGIDPTDGNNVSVGGNTNNNIYRYSRDGGASFSSSVGGLHADVHAIAYSPVNPSVIYHANDGGIWKSYDAGLSWYSLNDNSLNTFQYSGIALHPTDRNFTLAGTQDNGTHMIRPDGSAFRVDFGDGGYSLIDQNAANTTNVTMYHTYFNQANNLIGTGRVFNVPCATEGNWSFHGIYGGAVDPTPYCDGSTDTFNGIALADPVLFYAPMTLGPGNPNTWYFGTDKLYRSADKADTAAAVSQVLQAGTPVSAIGISPQDDTVRLVGLNNGKVFATANGSSTLLQIAGTGATNGTTTTPAAAVGRIVVDPNNKNVAYVAFGGFGTTASPISHVWKTTNLNALNTSGSVVFTAMSSGLPDRPANALAIDPQSGSASSNSTDIYAGTDDGVYISRDGGTSWNRYGTGFPLVSVFGLEIQNPQRVVRAATHGRGMFETYTALQPSVPLLSQVVSRKAHGSAGNFDIFMPQTGPAGVESRIAGPGNTHTIILTFTNTIVSGNITVSGGTGMVSSTSFNGNDVTVNLSGVTDAQLLTLSLMNIQDANGGTLASGTVQLGFLLGDVNGDHTVNSGDSQVEQNTSGTAVNSSSAPTDVNLDGFTNGGDALVVRNASSHSF